MERARDGRSASDRNEDAAVDVRLEAVEVRLAIDRAIVPADRLVKLNADPASGLEVDLAWGQDRKKDV